MAEIHVADAGTRLTVTVVDEDGAALDISGATTKQLWLKPPSGTRLTKTATFTTDGTDGKLYYDLLATDLTEAGEWELQAYVVTPAGTWHSDITRFDVAGNL